ncbi:MAG: START domain-containing protein [Myxococcota bacterium]|nr:START domain-containing protein [Myxococcota bacterium]
MLIPTPIERMCLGILRPTILLGFFCLTTHADSQTSIRWEKLYTTNGITVSAGHRTISDLPILRGEGVMNVNVYRLLAIVEDVKRHHEWVSRVDHSTIMDRPDPFHMRAYVRFDFPWPASDRDGIIDVTVKRVWAPHHEIMVQFGRVSDRRRPPLDGVVRVPRSLGFTRLRWLNPRQTHVIYQLDSDPGGRLPRWLIRWIAKDLPSKILRGLKRQVQRTARDYDEFLRRWDPRLSWQPDSPPSFELSGVAPETLVPPPRPAPSPEDAMDRQ